jgi:hypothetical protein
VLGRGGEPRLVRAAIAQRVQRTTLKPAGKTHIATGVRVWLGGVAVRMVPGARHERIAISASPSRSRHKSFVFYEMSACTAQAITETAWPANFR